MRSVQLFGVRAAWVQSLLVVCGLSAPVCAQLGDPGVKQTAQQEAGKQPVVSAKEAVTIGAARLATLQEKSGDEGEPEQWPYEGVYRVDGQIPIGYRIGGTAIALQALCVSPEYGEREELRGAVARGAAYLCTARTHELMSYEDYDAGYDVRTWGAIYALDALCLLKQMHLVPSGQEQACDDAAAWYLAHIQALEMPKTGGWNYARPPGRDKVGAPSPFMTSAAVLALVRAEQVGMQVDGGVLSRALDSLERAHSEVGSVAYAGEGKTHPDPTPGAIGRMCASESALLAGGRGSVRDARSAVDAFFTHWGRLEERRAKTGTHIGPFAVAPYYFMYAHRAAAECIERLPENERKEYRARFDETLFRTRSEEGTWNDRVFPRSANYGTATAVLALCARSQPLLVLTKPAPAVLVEPVKPGAGSGQ